MGLGGISFSSLLGFVFVFALVFALIPVLLVLASKRVQGGEKIGWALIVLFTSYLGYGFFLVGTQKNRQTLQA